ncbi:hypothetical protein [uncultured Methanobrevibacter sp.]|nr:hypothetical protein [uncultured Methanobrevibacter sp.]
MDGIDDKKDDGYKRPADLKISRDNENDSFKNFVDLKFSDES